MKRRDFLKETTLAAGSFAMPNWLQRYEERRKKPTVLVYGFNAFEDEINISQKVVERLQDTKFRNAKIVTAVLPTEREFLLSSLDDLFKKYKPDVTVGLGEQNVATHHIPDIKIETAASYNSTRIESDPGLQYQLVSNAFEQQGLQVQNSQNPGPNACGQSLHYCLSHFEQKDQPKRAFFLHLKDPIARKIENFPLPMEGLGSFHSPTAEELEKYDELCETYTQGVIDTLRQIDKIAGLPDKSRNRS